MIKRHPDNPIITPKDIQPYHDNFEVIGVFNAGVAEYQGETLLLLRVAERPISTNSNIIKVPYIDFSSGKGTLKIDTLDATDTIYDFSDPRTIYYHTPDQTGAKPVACLTSISYVRIARSKDGYHFTIDDKPFIYPETIREAWGIEDPRVTEIDGTYYIQYSAVSPEGIGVGLVSTTDFIAYERLGLMLHPENKDVAIFPEMINGKYYTLHRPVPGGIGSPEIWIAESENLRHWGNHQFLFGLSKDEDGWENGRIGGGAVPFKTDEGWLEIYHAADQSNRYCLGAVLLDLNDPSIIIGKTQDPIMEPVEDYETSGFFSDVVFTCGVTRQGDNIRIYYGASDTSMAVADVSLAKIMSHLKRY